MGEQYRLTPWQEIPTPSSCDPAQRGPAMIKITKFGGSSVANAAQFRKVKHIIESDPSRRFVVVSAVGRAQQAPTTK